MNREQDTNIDYFVPNYRELLTQDQSDQMPMRKKYTKNTVEFAKQLDTMYLNKMLMNAKKEAKLKAQ